MGTRFDGTGLESDACRLSVRQLPRKVRPIYESDARTTLPRGIRERHRDTEAVLPCFALRHLTARPSESANGRCLERLAPAPPKGLAANSQPETSCPSVTA